MATWEVSDANDTAMTDYKGLRLAQDGVMLTTDEALEEMFAICTTIKNRGNKF
jgi:hypothetical protein